MNRKSTVEAAPYAEALRPTHEESIRVKIEGLRVDFQEDGVFFLDNVSTVQIDPLPIGKELETAGISRHDAAGYVDEFLEKIYADQLAKLLVKRMTRVY